MMPVQSTAGSLDGTTGAAETAVSADEQIVAELQGASLLRAARLKRGWSQRRMIWHLTRLAQSKGLTQIATAESLKRQLSRWENGQHMPEFYKPLLCELFDASPAELGFTRHVFRSFKNINLAGLLGGENLRDELQHRYAQVDQAISTLQAERDYLAAVLAVPTPGTKMPHPAPDHALTVVR